MEIADSIVHVNVYPPMPSTAKHPDATLFEPHVKLARKDMAWENDRTHVLSQLQTRKFALSKVLCSLHG